jgi:hypothetical protein
MIKINRIPDFELCLYSPDNQFIGILRYDSEFLDVLLQIREANVDGYYLVDLSNNNRRIPIERTGFILQTCPFNNRNDNLMQQLFDF